MHKLMCTFVATTKKKKIPDPNLDTARAFRVINLITRAPSIRTKFLGGNYRNFPCQMERLFFQLFYTCDLTDRSKHVMTQ